MSSTVKCNRESPAKRKEKLTKNAKYGVQTRKKVV